MFEVVVLAVVVSVFSTLTSFFVFSSTGAPQFGQALSVSFNSAPQFSQNLLIINPPSISNKYIIYKEILFVNYLTKKKYSYKIWVLI